MPVGGGVGAQRGVQDGTGAAFSVCALLLSPSACWVWGGVPAAHAGFLSLVPGCFLGR